MSGTQGPLGDRTKWEKILFNLLHEKWIPVRRKTGEPEFIAPQGIVIDHTSNPVLSLEAPRPDFNGALYQFLIGLVQTAYPPADEREWQKKFRTAPSPEALASAFDRYDGAFNLDGDGPRFMQDLDLDPKESKSNPIEHLFMDMPGEQTLKNNADHFLKRETVNWTCKKCSSTALFTLQTNAPSGGQGHRTSLRGGGPLTTLIMGRTLWETIWLNVLTSNGFDRLGNAGKKSDADIFPWMGKTRTSAKDEITTSQDVNPAQMFWGMPRRIRLSFEESDKLIHCDICGCSTNFVVSSYVTKGHGVNYEGGWHHTLSPYFIPQKTNESRPYLNHSGISYRNWLGLVQSTVGRNSKNEPAYVVHNFRQFRENDLAGASRIPFRLLAFGYDMNKMKAKGWYEGGMPLISVPERIRPDYESYIIQMITTANYVESIVQTSIKSALFKPRLGVKGKPDKTVKVQLNFVEAEFWQDTEPEFYRILEDLRVKLDQHLPPGDLKLRWLSILSKEGERLFDRYGQSNTISIGDPKRIAISRNKFSRMSSQYNEIIQNLLDIPKPPARTESGTPAATKRGRKKT
jgi:CRISPR system Cascade subunit CasA